MFIGTNNILRSYCEQTTKGSCSMNNLIPAVEARAQVLNYNKNIIEYDEYIAYLNKVINVESRKGVESIVIDGVNDKLPSDIIADKVMQELERAGYDVDWNGNVQLKISWSG